MDSVDSAVLMTAIAWFRTGRPLWLATVVQTFGSSPRPIGSIMVMRADGMVAGSVSGGCIEDDLADKARRGDLSTTCAMTITYGRTRDEAMSFGLPCGGSLTIVIEPLLDIGWMQSMLKAIGEHRLVARTLDLADLTVELADATRGSALVLQKGKLTTIHGPQWRLLIIGAAQTSVYLAQMAQALDYEVVVCDPREEYRRAWNVQGTRLIADMPDDAVLAEQVNGRTAVVALTHDPKLDDMALLEALKSPAFYVGALGSHRNSQQRRQRLALFDLTAEEIGRLHGPVGLDISSRTPPEIAVSILAHIISIKNRMHVADPVSQPVHANA